MLDSLRPIPMKYKKYKSLKVVANIYTLRNDIARTVCVIYSLTSPRIKTKTNKKDFRKKSRLSPGSYLVDFRILQFGFSFQQRHQFLCQHNVAGDFQFSLHECHLWIQFAQCNVNHILIGDRQCCVGLRFRCTFVHFCVFQVQSCIN